MAASYKKLDNPAWHALTETHSRFATGTDALKKYDPDIVLFAGMDTKTTGLENQLDQVFLQQDSFFLFDNFPPLPENYQVETVIECLQMVCDKPVDVRITEKLIQLDETHTTEMFALVNQVFPGYYLPQTRRMGDYFGIFKETKLVAMAGERLCMEGFTEISAVVTHPDFTGRTYAQQLVSYLNNKNRQAGIIPFLHTGATNTRAIQIYERLGYKKRRVIPVTRIKRTM
jgi:GNAT superfamily N-acetyltransferase